MLFLVGCLEDLDNLEVGGKGNLKLLLRLIDLLRELEDLEGSVDFMSFEARKILEEAKRKASIRYIV